ncbi:MAG: sensor histidine kinase N-terminal domain-containing protein [Burkholderiales bacterium]
MRNEIDRPRLSFAAKFVEWLLGPLVYLWLATAAFGIFMIAQAVDASFDARLTDLAHAVAGHLVPTGNTAAPLRLTPAGEALLHADRFDDRHYALRGTDGRVFAGDPDMPQVTGALDDEGADVQGGVLGDDTVRIAAVPVPVPGAGEGRVMLQVAETLARRRELTASLRAESFLPQLLLLGGSFALVWYGLTYVIAPMRRLKSAIDRRDSLDLTPIDPVQAPEEMQPLIESVNALLARVEDNFEVQRRFIADAAHQLRTPLAGLKSQTELALAERDPEAMRSALQRLEQATGRTIHLANRLLALARAGTVHAPDHVPVPLLPLAREIVGEFVPRAVERDIDLGLEADELDPPALERADPLLIREMVSNLVDNALRYTPPGGIVTVAVRRTAAGAAEIDVVDSGPGIAPEERERVFDPFYRGADAAPGGTGLGLAIVRAIANAHHAEIQVGSGERGRGTVIRITFREPEREG